MDESFLIDTTIWVKYLRGIDKTLKDKIGSLILGEAIYTSEIIIMEILRGAKSKKEYMSLYEDFIALKRIELDEAVWEKAWMLAYNLRKKGMNIPLTDVVISTLAIHSGCTLLHSDRHYKMISRYTNLKEKEL